MVNRRVPIENMDAAFKTAMLGTFVNPASVVRAAVWGFFGLGFVAYVLFQKKLLPRPVAKVVSKILFYPTFPITAMMRLGNYWTPVDDTLILGCAPFGIANHPEKLHKLGVRGVVNMCYEYPGPVDKYADLNIKQLRLPTVDHEEPTLDSFKEAMAFIKSYKDRNEKVYVHCKAGHGRAASVAYAWMLTQNPSMTPKEINEVLCSKRKVRKTLYKQRTIKTFYDKHVKELTSSTCSTSTCSSEDTSKSPTR